MQLGCKYLRTTISRCASYWLIGHTVAFGDEGLGQTKVGQIYTILRLVLCHGCHLDQDIMGLDIHVFGGLSMNIMNCGSQKPHCRGQKLQSTEQTWGDLVINRGQSEICSVLQEVPEITVSDGIHEYRELAATKIGANQLDNVTMTKVL